MSFINLFKTKNFEIGHGLSTRSYGGIIRQLNLEEFWRSLTDKEKNMVRNVCKRSYGLSGFKIDEVDSYESSLTTRREASAFLLGIGIWTFEMERYDLTEKLLLKAIEMSKNLATVHRCYTWLIKIHDKLRLDNHRSVDECISYCKQDIAILPLLFDENEQHNRQHLNLIPFTVLMKIYNELGYEHEYNETENLYQYYKSLI